MGVERYGGGVPPHAPLHQSLGVLITHLSHIARRDERDGAILIAAVVAHMLLSGGPPPLLVERPS